MFFPPIWVTSTCHRNLNLMASSRSNVFDDSPFSDTDDGYFNKMIDFFTRHRQAQTHSLLDIIFDKWSSTVSSIQLLSPVWKNEHVVTGLQPPCPQQTLIKRQKCKVMLCVEFLKNVACQCPWASIFDVKEQLSQLRNAFLQLTHLAISWKFLKRKTCFLGLRKGWSAESTKEMSWEISK